jgi:hypothetical protein
LLSLMQKPIQMSPMKMITARPNLPPMPNVELPRIPVISVWPKSASDML